MSKILQRPKKKPRIYCPFGRHLDIYTTIHGDYYTTYITITAATKRTHWAVSPYIKYTYCTYSSHAHKHPFTNVQRKVELQFLAHFVRNDLYMCVDPDRFIYILYGFFVLFLASLHFIELLQKTNKFLGE